MRNTGADVRGYRLEVYRDPEDDTWVAEVPDLPGCAAATEDPRDLMATVDDAIRSWIEGAESSGRAVPPPTRVDEDYSGRFLLRLTKTMHRQLADRARREGVSLNTLCGTALAESLGASRSRQSVEAAFRRGVDEFRSVPTSTWPTTPQPRAYGGARVTSLLEAGVLTETVSRLDLQPRGLSYTVHPLVGFGDTNVSAATILQRVPVQVSPVGAPAAAPAQPADANRQPALGLAS